MALETGTYVGDLVAANPTLSDPKSQGDDHLRLIKTALRNCFAGFTGAVIATGADSGAANTYVLTPAQALPAYTLGMVVEFVAANANTGASTLNISGLGAVAIKTVDGVALGLNDILAGQAVMVIHDGTAFRLLAVTKHYIDQLAFAASLPLQGGNAGKILVTDGTNASWTNALTIALNEAKGADIASAATINLTTATGNFVHVTGTTTITAITIPVGAERTVVFDGALTLTHGAALLLPGAANIVTAAGDRMVVRGDTAGANVVSYTRTNGQAVYATKQFRTISYLPSSGTYVAPANGLLRITLRGADGSGAVAISLNDTASSAVASGGAAGGLSVKTLQVKTGDTFTATLAAGGAQVTTSSAGAHVNGNAGGTSTVTGPSTSMTANGGAGGIGANAATGAVSAAGAAGGTASGGDANYTGGGSGTAAVTVGYGVAATGGGAVAWNGTSYSSGNATTSAASGSGAASGGAGTGGASGVALQTTVSQASTTGGGGAMGSSPSATNSNGAQGAGCPSTVTSTPITLVGQGSSVGGGAGGGAFASTLTSTSTAGGILAGGGAAIVYVNAGSPATVVAAGGQGGSTGGAAARAGGSGATTTAQAGADAFAIFEWTET